MEKISWTEYVRSIEVLQRVKEERNILHEIRKGKANWIGHILVNYELPPKVRYKRKDRGKNRSDSKKREET